MRTSCGNPNGFHIWIMGKSSGFIRKFYCNYLERKKAEDWAYTRWVNEVVLDDTGMEVPYKYCSNI